MNASRAPPKNTSILKRGENKEMREISSSRGVPQGFCGSHTNFSEGGRGAFTERGALTEGITVCSSPTRVWKERGSARLGKRESGESVGERELCCHLPNRHRSKTPFCFLISTEKVASGQT